MNEVVRTEHLDIGILVVHVDVLRSSKIQSKGPNGLTAELGSGIVLSNIEALCRWIGKGTTATGNRGPGTCAGTRGRFVGIYLQRVDCVLAQ